MKEKEETRTEQSTQPQKSNPKLSPSAYQSSILVLIVISIASFVHWSENTQPFKPFIDTSAYRVESDVKIYAGEIHYSRIPVEYWEQRILMVKAMGLNSLSVYIMWNYHEVSRGVFDFSTGNRNLTLFLELAKKHNLMVLIRPGPYVCAEWDFGGLPARLLSIPGLIIRSNNPLYIA